MIDILDESDLEQDDKRQVTDEEEMYEEDCRERARDMIEALKEFRGSCEPF